MRATIRIALALCLWAPLAFAQLNDVGVSQTGPTSAPANSDVTYVITAFNDGTTVVSPVLLTDSLPAGMSFTSLVQNSGPAFACTVPTSGTLINPGDSLSCTITALNGGVAAVFTLILHIPVGTAGGTAFTNVASVANPSPDDIPENDTVGIGTTVITPTANVGVLKIAAGQAAPGSNLTYTLAVVNAGPDAAASVTLTDPLPGNLTFSGISQISGPAFGCTTPAVGAGGTVTCTRASMPAGTTATFSLVTNVPSGTSSATQYTNVATVATSTFDPDSSNDTATFSTTVSNSDVSVNKTGPSTATVGSTATYTLTVRNNGPDTATAVVLTDALPATTRFALLTQTSGPSASCSTPTAVSGGTVTCILTTLASGQSAVFSLSATVLNSAGGGTISNTASVTSDSADSNPANNSAIAQTAVPTPPSIPTLSVLGLWLLGLAMLSAGWFALRRRAALL